VLIPNNLPREEGDSLAVHRTGTTTITDKECLVVELCQSDLFDLISKVGPITDRQLLRAMFNQICVAVSAMHQANLCHLDLKIDNIMVGADYSLRLADFGFVSSTLEPIKIMTGTISSMAPEILNERRSTYDGIKADIFSLGLILYILFFGRPAFSKADDSCMFWRTKQSKPSNFFRLHPTSRSLYKEGLIDSDLMDLLIRMLSTDLINERPSSIAEVMNHSFFTKN